MHFKIIHYRILVFDIEEFQVLMYYVMNILYSIDNFLYKLYVLM